MSYITQSTSYDLQEDAFEYVINYTFEGYGIDIYAYKNKGFGIMNVYIDGVYNTQVDLYAASALYQQKVYSNTTLSSGTHNIKLVYTGTKNASANGYDINVDYFKVYNSNNDILTPRISKNFATTDWNMVPAAPLVKELNDRLVNVALQSWTYAELQANTTKNANWTEYELLIFGTGTYNNIAETIIVPMTYFNTTTSTGRVILYFGNSTIQIFKSASQGAIAVICSNLQTEQRLHVYGFIKK